MRRAVRNAGGTERALVAMKFAGKYWHSHYRVVGLPESRSDYGASRNGRSLRIHEFNFSLARDLIRARFAYSNI